jgi:predicted nucleic acid-binding protein
MDNIALLDTNILVHAANEDSPYHADAKSVIERINSGELKACLSGQILAEFYATLTNPKKVRQPLSVKEGALAIEGYLESDILKLYPRRDTLKLTLELVRSYQVKGLDIFDAQIVATMVENKIKTIYTANEKDFRRYKEIEVINPLTLSP